MCGCQGRIRLAGVVEGAILAGAGVADRGYRFSCHLDVCAAQAIDLGDAHDRQPGTSNLEVARRPVSPVRLSWDYPALIEGLAAGASRCALRAKLRRPNSLSGRNIATSGTRRRLQR